MPLIPNFINTLDKIKDLHKRKNDDYSGSFGAFFNFDFCESVSILFTNAKDKVYAIFISVKLARLAVVLSSSRVNNESIEDSFDDLICYATIWKCDYMSRSKPINNGKDANVTIRETPSDIGGINSLGCK